MDSKAIGELPAGFAHRVVSITGPREGHRGRTCPAVRNLQGISRTAPDRQAASLGSDQDQGEFRVLFSASVFNSKKAKTSVQTVENPTNKTPPETAWLLITPTSRVRPAADRLQDCRRIAQQFCVQCCQQDSASLSM